MSTQTIINKGTFFSIRIRNFEDGTNAVFLYHMETPIANMGETEFSELALLMSTTEYPGKD
jgi:hypothetical protein